jgi:DNA (cytosine-5)-methyltransferase 1
MSAYYNEIDPAAAQWLRNLIKAGLIAAGEVDERSIEDIRPDEIRGFTQVHFFAGIGVWSYALRRAGWDDTRPVWTGSCPCQPFSAAGKGTGFADERHLWPAWFHLINELRPAAIFGEQVASRDADPWLDLVQTDLEAMGYAIGAIPFPSAGIGAPHIRDRLYWMADANEGRWGWRTSDGQSVGNGASAGWIENAGDAAGRSAVRRMGNADDTGLEGFGSGHQASGGRIGALRSVAAPSESGRLADDASSGRREEHADTGRSLAGSGAKGIAAGLVHGVVYGGMADADHNGQQSGRTSTAAARHRNTTDPDGGAGGTLPTNGFWRDADWLGCRDGKWRPVEPGTFPLAYGAASRVVRLRAYGNAINAQAAQSMIEAYLQAEQAENKLAEELLEKAA